MLKDKISSGPQQLISDRFVRAVAMTGGSTGGVPSATDAWAAGGEPSKPDTVTILQAIEGSRQVLATRIKEDCSDVTLLRQDLRNTVDRVTEAEGRISELENCMHTIKVEVHQLTALNKELLG